MTRRLTITMVGVVAGALVLALLAAGLLLRVGARADLQRELRREATAMAQAIEDLQAPRALAAIGAALRLQDEQVLRFGPGGRTADAPPAGVTLADLDLSRLRDGQTLTGAHGSLVYAAAPAPRRTGVLLVVVLTRRTGTPVRRAAPVFAAASLLALAVAAAVALDLGRRLTKPLRAVQTITGRIASGDLSARVPDPHGEDEVASVAQSVNAMAAALERSRGLERQFLLSVSHDLRTPLTSIRGYAEALADGTATDAPRAAGVILRESGRLERLVADLLELAKLDARRFSLDVRATDVADVVAGTVEGFRPAADAAGVAVVASSAAGMPPVAADPDRLGQIAANLVENALKFSRRRITVGAAAVDGGSAVELWVDDDGPGVADDDLDSVFDAFYRSPRTPARAVGSGLGLAIVRELATAMRGSTRAEASPDGGARMVVRLPAWTAE